jgi:hypothetical protein
MPGCLSVQWPIPFWYDTGGGCRRPTRDAAGCMRLEHCYRDVTIEPAPAKAIFSDRELWCEFPHPKFSVTCLPQFITIGRDEFHGVVLRRSLARVTARAAPPSSPLACGWLKARSQERFLIGLCLLRGNGIKGSYEPPLQPGCIRVLN